MATEATLRHVDIDLRSIEAEVDDLPRLLEIWDTLSDNNQVSYLLEWDDLMGRLDFLERGHKAGDMTPAHEKRYKTLLAKLKKYDFIIKRLDLGLPRVAKWDKEAIT